MRSVTGAFMRLYAKYPVRPRTAATATMMILFRMSFLSYCMRRPIVPVACARSMRARLYKYSAAMRLSCAREGASARR